MDVNAMIEKMIIDFEGGFVQDKDDSGGATKYGITIGTLGRWFGRPATVAEVKSLDMQTAIKIYTKLYYLEFNLPNFPEATRPQIFDMYVQHKPDPTGEIIQKACNAISQVPFLVLDGKVGPKTILRVNSLVDQFGAKTVVNTLVAYNLRYYDYLEQIKPSNHKFENTWHRRANSYRIA